MNPGIPSPLAWPASAAGTDSPRPASWFGPATFVTVCAGFLTPFTVSLVGEMPIGELLLLAAAGWAGLCAIVHHLPPGPLFSRRYLIVLLVCQLVALLAYILSDFYRQSAPRDMARGWARMVLLAIDILALAYLLGRSPHNLLWFLGGQIAGDLANFLLFGARFEDTWKFGYGIPLTYGVILLSSLAGRAGVLLAAGGLGALHFAMDFRSLGGLCLLLAAATGLQMLPQRFRLWALPCCLLATLVVASLLFTRVRSGDEMEHRASRSDVDRSAMIQAATEAFLASPLIGHGSWFSRSDVYDNFVQIRADLAREAGVGGFVGPNEEPEDVALHSQILVTLAEGGIFGAAFFIAFGGGLLWTLWNLVMVRTWRRDFSIRVFLLLLSGWHLFMSPFSGAHRVYIALAVGLILLVQAEEPEEETA
jgi:hypothetical protein